MEKNKMKHPTEETQINKREIARERDELWRSACSNLTGAREAREAGKQELARDMQKTAEAKFESYKSWECPFCGWIGQPSHRRNARGIYFYICNNCHEEF